MDIEKISYHCFSGKPFENSASPLLYNKTFAHWKEFWTSEYQSYGSGETLNIGDFFRQDLFTLLTYEDKIIATHALSFFDTAYSIAEFPYLLHMHPNILLDRLKELKISTFSTCQFFMIEPKFRYRETRINFGAILVSLSILQQMNRGIDASLTAARTDVAAASLAQKIGFKPIFEPKIVHNVPVVTMVCEELKPYKRSIENDLVNHLWNSINTNQKGDKNENKRAA